jgi:hypothetical protein
MATALAIVSVVSGIFGGIKQSKIAKAQKKQNRLTNKIAAITRRRNVKRQIAASRIQVAQQQSAGFELGVSGSTSVAGAVSGIVGDTASSVGASNLQATGQGFIAGLQDNISSLQGQAGLFSTISSIAGGIAGNEQSVAGLEDLFGFGE